MSAPNECHNQRAASDSYDPSTFMIDCSSVAHTSCSEPISPYTPMAASEIQAQWSQPDAPHPNGSFAHYDGFSTFHFPSNVYPAESGNIWEFDPTASSYAASANPDFATAQSAHGYQAGICLLPSNEPLVFPIIISDDSQDEESSRKNRVPSYAQVTRGNTEETVESAASADVSGIHANEWTGSPTLVQGHADAGYPSTMYQDYSYVPFYPMNGDFHAGQYQPTQSFLTEYHGTPNRRKMAPRDQIDITSEFRQLTKSPLQTLFAGSRFKELQGETDGDESATVTHIRQEFTFIALANMYQGRHFHELDPMELGEFNHSLGLVLEALPTASTIIIPVGYLRKEHPSPHCLVQCEDFAEECERLDVERHPFIAVEFDEDTECKDITSAILSICKGQLNFLKQTSLLQAMKDRIDLTLLYFLIYDCFRSDFVNFDIEFRSIREGPLQIVIRTSKKYVCKRKGTAQCDLTTPGIDCRVAHGTEQWKKLPDAPICGIATPHDGRSVLPPVTSVPVSSLVEGNDAPQEAVTLSQRFRGFFTSIHSRSFVFSHVVNCRNIRCVIQQASLCRCPFAILRVPAFVKRFIEPFSHTLSTINEKTHCFFSASPMSCQRHAFSSAVSLPVKVACTVAILGASAAIFLRGRCKIMQATKGA